MYFHTANLKLYQRLKKKKDSKVNAVFSLDTTKEETLQDTEGTCMPLIFP